MGARRKDNMAARQKTMWPLYHLITSTVFTSVRTWTRALLSAQPCQMASQSRSDRRPSGSRGCPLPPGVAAATSLRI